MNILGIDPGINGALCLLDITGKFLEISDMPVVVSKVINGKAKKTINFRGLQLILSAWLAEYGELVCYLENVHSFPSRNKKGEVVQGGVAIFTMGESLGAVKAIVTCEGIEINYVAPQTWKKFHKIPMGANISSGDKKELSRACAIRVCPQAAQYLDRKKDHNRAEALLIARYGVKQNER